MEKITGADISQAQMALLQEMRKIAVVSSQQIIPVGGSDILSSAVLNSDAGIPSFAQVFNQAIESVNQLQNSASDKQTAYDMGLNDDLATTMLESQKASVAFSALLQTRNKLTGALDELINIPL